MKNLRILAALGLVFAVLAGCGPQDVTSSSVDDAMKERSEKAKNLKEKEGQAPDDHASELNQDPQAGARK